MDSKHNGNDNGNGNDKQKKEYCLCPICGVKRKQKPGHLVCYPCKEQFVQEETEKFEKGEEVIDIKEWVLEKARKVLESLREQFPSKSAEYDALQSSVKSEAYEAVVKMANGKSIPQGVFTNAMRNRSKELFQKKGGNKLHAEFKTMEQQIKLLEELIPSLENRIAEDEAARKEQSASVD